LSSTYKNALVELKDASYGPRKSLILKELNWSLAPGQHWAVLGANGAGKSTFLRLVRGEIWPRIDGGSRLYHLNGQREESPIAFRQASALVSAELLDRYQRREWNLTALQTVCTGFNESVYLQEEASPDEQRAARQALAQVGLADKEREPLLRLSRGQIKRVLIARALVRQPKVLILDEALEDLDAGTRAELTKLLTGLTEKGVSLLYATHRQEELFPALNHFLVLEEGRITSQGPRHEIAMERDAPTEAGEIGVQTWHAVGESAGAGPMVAIKNAEVFRDRRRVLQGIDWTIEPGQSWALLGPNGAGKTTLLMLLAGELTPALGGQVAWFGEYEHPGLWQLRAHVGLVSGDLQARHKRPSQTGLDTVISGLQGSIGLSALPTPNEIKAAQDCLEGLGLANLAERVISKLSYGQMRKLMIARAMVTGPRLLLLDEPLAGLDSRAKAGVLEVVERLIRRGVSLVMVSHHAEDLPPSLTHVAQLEEGRLVFMGARPDYLKKT
jgi:molybdate transport system ATP-binding protein